VDRLKDALSFPLRMAGALLRIGGRLTVGSVGFLLMGAGLLLVSPFRMPYAGIPLFLVGLLLLARAVF
jgi:hypothetical protein